MPRTSSTAKQISIADRAHDLLLLVLSQLELRGKGPDFADLREKFSEYDRYTRQFVGKSLLDCQIVEIGYGARPHRLCWLTGHGARVVGIDLDRPLIRFDPVEISRIYRQNGWLRAIKSTIRVLLTDGHYWRAMAREAESASGRPFVFPIDSLKVGNAASEAFWTQNIGADLIYSEDVFEHIAPDDLERLVSIMASSMSPDGVALIRPLVFTGISGGHSREWFPGLIDVPRHRVTEPWEHLRQRRHTPDIYLNEFTRHHYRNLFIRHFDIVEERVMEPGLGRSFLTNEIRQELAAYPEDDLLSNTVLFVLRPKRPKI